MTKKYRRSPNRNYGNPKTSRVRTDVPVHDRRSSDVPAAIMVGTITVDDPYDQGGGKIQVYRTLREDPLAAMHNAGQVDDAMFMAGRHWQRAYELAEIGGASAIDPTKEAVDGGLVPEPFTDAQRKAVATLMGAKDKLGHYGDMLVRDILGERMTVKIAAARRGFTSELAAKYVGRRFRECLETLAEYFGYAMAVPAWRRKRSQPLSQRVRSNTTP